MPENETYAGPEPAWHAVVQDGIGDEEPRDSAYGGAEGRELEGELERRRVGRVEDVARCSRRSSARWRSGSAPTRSSPVGISKKMLMKAANGRIPMNAHRRERERLRVAVPGDDVRLRSRPRASSASAIQRLLDERA